MKDSDARFVDCTDTRRQGAACFGARISYTGLDDCVFTLDEVGPGGLIG